MKGLTSIQASQFLTQYGQNIIVEQKKKQFILKFLEQFNNFLTLLLIIAAGLSFIIGEPVDGTLILSIVILNACFGLYQEKKAEESIAALKKMSVTKIRVMRDDKEINIDSRYLVPGDAMYIEEGTKIPADGKLIESINLEINESALTGESLPVLKHIKDEIFSGSIVAKGRGWVEITTTGMKTKFGTIAQNLSSIEEIKTPLQKKLEDLTRLIGVIGIGISIAVFILSMIRGDGYFPAFLLSVSLAVAVVPEGLPAVMTITLAIGVKEMAKRKSVIRKLSAIEALGSITLIATDKTGTLTTNQMQVKEVYVENKIFEENSFPSIENNTFSHLVLNGILCSTASLVYIHDHGKWDVLGDPTEGALLYLGQRMKLIPDFVRLEWKLIDEIPFDSVTKIMTVLVEKNKRKIVYSKGAPESILNVCNLSDMEKEKIMGQVEKWARKGLRVLAFAYNIAGSEKILSEPSQLEKMKFLGMVAIHDAPRLEVIDAVKKAKEAGIKVIMITGDNEKTAEAIGVSTGIIQKNDEILTGKQLDEYSDNELIKVLPKVKIFARTSPFQKHRIIKLYQDLGEVVAVTGDGVNDAIALKQADVGVAMGLVGTDVARETADMVITDDNFASIVCAIEEGRNIIKNLKNAIKYLLACNIAEALSLTVGLLLGIPHLFFAIQLLYVNLITDGIPALSLAFSPREEHSMRRPPDTEMKLLRPFEKKYIFSVGLIATFLILASYFIFAGQNDLLGKTAAFSVLILIQSFILVDLWLSHRSVRLNLHQLKNPLFIVSFIAPFFLQYLIVTLPGVSNLFKITHVRLTDFIFFAAISFLVLPGISIIKRLR
jgi:Ca2+-transporting ATPase